MKTPRLSVPRSKPLRLTKHSVQEIVDAETDAVEEILAVESSIKEVVVGRSVEIRGLILAIVAAQHFMVEGEPGTAKTMLATEFADRIENGKEPFKFFKTQLSRGMVSDQLLGPTNIMKLREEAVYEYNTARMLPDAHLVILDEVYRGPEMLLPVILSILNERKFHNGSKIQEVPLITAVGTTNFITQSDELRAFHDRWLVNCTVSRLSSAEERLTMLTQSLAPRKPRSASITLEQIRELHKRRAEVTIPKAVLQLYDGLVQQIIARGKNTLRFQISDRRIVAALRLAQVSALLKGRTKATPDDLIATEYGLVVKGIKAEETIFSDSFTAEVGTYQKLQQEEERLELMRTLRSKYYNAYGEGLSKDRLTKLREALCHVITDCHGAQYSQSGNEQEYRRMFKEFETLLAQVGSDLQS